MISNPSTFFLFVSSCRGVASPNILGWMESYLGPWGRRTPEIFDEQAFQKLRESRECWDPPKSTPWRRHCRLALFLSLFK